MEARSGEAVILPGWELVKDLWATLGCLDLEVFTLLEMQSTERVGLVETLP